MTFNRIQNIEASIVELRDAFERSLTTVLIPAPPQEVNGVERDSRTFLARSLGDVELAVEQLRGVLTRIAL